MTLTQEIKLTIDAILCIFAAVGTASTGILALLVLSGVSASDIHTHPERPWHYQVIEVEITRHRQ